MPITTKNFKNMSNITYLKVFERVEEIKNIVLNNEHSHYQLLIRANQFFYFFYAQENLFNQSPEQLESFEYQVASVIPYL